MKNSKEMKKNYRQRKWKREGNDQDEIDGNNKPLSESMKTALARKLVSWKKIQE